MKFFAWLKHWFKKAVAASSRPDFYRRIEERTPAEALGHLAMLTAILWVLPFMVFFFIEMRHGVQAVMQGLRTQVPAGTTFEMKKGVLTSNLPAPLTVTLGSAIVVIDTATATHALPPYAEGSLYMTVIGSDGVTQRTSDHEASQLSFQKTPDFRVTREELIDNIRRWTPLALFFGSLVAVCAVFILYLVGFLASVIVHALALWLALRLFKRSWPMKRAFVAAAFASTLPIALNAALTLAGLDFELLPNLLFWVILAWIVYDTVKRSPAPGKGNDAGRKEAVDRPDPKGTSGSV